jgi:hypothetical protein
MTTDTDRTALVERLAQEAGMSNPRPYVWRSGGLEGVEIGDLECFAALVAEECARACEELNMWSYDDPASSAAAAIRARFGLAARQEG